MRPQRLPRITPILSAAFFSSAPAAGVLKVGDVLRQTRRFAGPDVVRYSEVTGDRNPIHLDAAFPRRVAGFGRGPVVHGLLVASIFPAVIASSFPGAIYASQSLRFKLPVYVDYEVVAEVQAANIRQIKENYYVKWTTKCYTSEECLVIDGEATTIMPTITPSE